MARMIPPIVSVTAPTGERLLFDKLKDDPETTDWVVFHSLDIKRHRIKIEGEIDFLVLVPGGGVLCIEVKSCSVERAGGKWIYPYGISVEGPFRQASTAMHSLRDYIVGRDCSLAGLMFFSSVIFTHYEFNEQSPEWHPWQYVSQAGILRKPISWHITNILSRAHQLIDSKKTVRAWYEDKTSRPTMEQIGRIVSILRKDFEYFVSPATDVAHLENAIREFTEEQFDALDQMIDNERIVFKGAAGTGKTFLAIEATRRALENGNKVLFLCFNKLLGEWIEKQTDGLPCPGHNNLKRGTFHRLLTEITGLTPEGEDSNVFWQSTLPLAAVDKLLGGEYENSRYDFLVIDETQDLLREEYLDVLELLLEGGLAGGKWIAFGDFERQAIYLVDGLSSAEDSLRLLSQRAPQHSNFLLRTNCRNAEPIASTLSIASGLIPGYKKILHGAEGADVDPIFYKNMETQVDHLRKGIERLQAVFKSEDIVILSMKRDESACASKLSGRVGGALILPIRRVAGNNAIGYTTIHAFKGLEAGGIILTDIEKMDDDHAKALLYIGMSRARVRLIMLMSESCRKSYDGILEAGLKNISKEG